MGVIMMKRKVVQHGPSTLIVSLPSKWVKEYNISKGDELEVVQENSKIVISTSHTLNIEKAELDISGLDRTSILINIRSAYRMGFDIIRINFNDQLTQYFRMKKKEKVTSVIHQEINRLIGLEIVEQKENYCTVKSLSKVSVKEFDNVLRRVLLLTIDVGNDLVTGLSNNDIVLLETIDDKHDTITKFVSYCLRILNKTGHPDPKKTNFLYHIVATLDKIVDIIKYSARDARNLKPKTSMECIRITKNIVNSLVLYYEMFYKYDKQKIVKISKNREDVVNDIKKCSKSIPTEELLILTKLEQILEEIFDITEERMGLEY